MNNHGFTIIEALIVGGITGLMVLAFLRSSANIQRTNGLLTDKIIAESYALELNEAFRAMKPADMKAYLSSSLAPGTQLYVLCKEIYSSSNVVPVNEIKYVDSISGLPDSTALKSPQRSFRIRIVKISTLQDSGKCGKLTTVATPDPGEVYMMTSTVSWGLGNKEKVTLSTIIPDGI
jgi:hypothetical protein